VWGGLLHIDTIAYEKGFETDDITSLSLLSLIVSENITETSKHVYSQVLVHLSGTAGTLAVAM